MQNNEQVFLYMKEEIERLAKQEEQALLQEMQQSKDEIYEQLVYEAKKEAQLEYDIQRKEIQKETSSDHLLKSSEYTKALVTKRDNYVQEIMNLVKQQLIDFVSSNQYLDYLKEKLTYTKEQYTFLNPILYIRQEDMQYSSILKDIYPEVEIKECSKSIIGGFLLEDLEKGLFIDQSFDFVLENQKTWFYENSGFTLK